MIALSLVERELRVRGRQPLTTWLRVGVAAAATLIVAVWLEQGGSQPPAERGRMVFSVLTWLGFALALSEGARRTADAISAEKRDGTLGLLFLTDLGGFDIVLGKLTAASVLTVYGLLAVFPVMGIALAVGGVTAGEFWRTQLALLTTGLVAATAGLWVSSRSEDPLRALLAVVGLMAGLVGVPLLLGAAPGAAGLRTLSPAAAVWLAGDAPYGLGPARFWVSQFLLAGLAAGLLVAAGRGTARAWRESARPPTAKARPGPAAAVASRWTYRIPARLHAAPGRSAGGPARGLMGSQRGTTPLVWVALGLPLLNRWGIQLLVPLLGGASQVPGVFSVLHLGFQVLSVAILATVAARPLAELRRSGALELLLCTPVPGAHWVEAHWEPLWRRVRLALLVCVVAPTLLLVGTWGLQSRGGGPVPWNYLLLMLVPLLAEPVAAVVAACWVGLWLGLRARTLGHAVGQTVLVVVVGPVFAGMLMQAILTRWVGARLFSGSGSVWLVWLVPGLVNLAWLVGLTLHARRELRDRFRQHAAGEDRSWLPGWFRKKPSPPGPVSG